MRPPGRSTRTASSIASRLAAADGMPQVDAGRVSVRQELGDHREQRAAAAAEVQYLLVAAQPQVAENLL